MFRRRDEHYHAEAMIFRIAATALMVLVASAGMHLLAGNQAVTSDGVVHTVEAEVWTSGKTAAGTVLLHTVQNPDGSTSTAYIPGTDDHALDKQLDLDIDPVNDAPVLVWSRFEGDGFDLMASRFQAGSWSVPLRVHSDPTEILGAQLTVRQNLAHIFWERNDFGETPVRTRLSLERNSLNPVFGPETLPIESASLVPPQGDRSPGSTADATEDLSYFTSRIPPLDNGQPGVLAVYGIRDEPVPVGYFVARLYPSEVLEANDADTEWIAHEFVQWFTTVDRYYYSIETDGAWSDFRLIELDDGMTALEARMLLVRMLKRKSLVQPE